MFVKLTIKQMKCLITATFRVEIVEPKLTSDTKINFTNQQFYSNKWIKQCTVNFCVGGLGSETRKK